MLELERRKIQPKFLSTNQKNDVYRWDMNLIFVDEKKMQELNRTFRNQDCVTDILSFSNESMLAFHWRRDLQSRNKRASIFKRLTQKFRHAFCTLFACKAELTLSQPFKYGSSDNLQSRNNRARNRGAVTLFEGELTLSQPFKHGSSHTLQDSNVRAGNRGEVTLFEGGEKTPSGCDKRAGNRGEVTLFEGGEKTPSGCDNRARNRGAVTLFEGGEEASFLGELVLCLPFIYRRATELDFSHWLYYLIVHGVLHLFGFQHELSDRESEKMYRIQDEVFETLASGIREQR